MCVCVYIHKLNQCQFSGYFFSLPIMEGGLAYTTGQTVNHLGLLQSLQWKTEHGARFSEKRPIVLCPFNHSWPCSRTFLGKFQAKLLFDFMVLCGNIPKKLMLLPFKSSIFISDSWVWGPNRPSKLQEAFDLAFAKSYANCSTWNFWQASGTHKVEL